MHFIKSISAILPNLCDGIYGEFYLVKVFSNCRDILGIKSLWEKI